MYQWEKYGDLVNKKHPEYNVNVMEEESVGPGGHFYDLRLSNEHGDMFSVSFASEGDYEAFKELLLKAEKIDLW